MNHSQCHIYCVLHCVCVVRTHALSFVCVSARLTRLRGYGEWNEVEWYVAMATVNRLCDFGAHQENVIYSDSLNVSCVYLWCRLPGSCFTVARAIYRNLCGEIFIFLIAGIPVEICENSPNNGKCERSLVQLSNLIK